jgi:hypothetical protein
MALEIFEEIFTHLLGWVVDVRNVATPNLSLGFRLTLFKQLVLDLFIVEDKVARLDYSY